MRKFSGLTLILLAACTSSPATQPPTAKSPTATSPGTDPCLSATLDRYKGELATSDLGARMLATTRKTELRWVRPGMMVTMDYREDRLTVYLTAANKVERASCG